MDLLLLDGVLTQSKFQFLDLFLLVLSTRRLSGKLVYLGFLRLGKLSHNVESFLELLVGDDSFMHPNLINDSLRVPGLEDRIVFLDVGVDSNLDLIVRFLLVLLCFHRGWDKSNRRHSPHTRRIKPFAHFVGESTRQSCPEFHV